MHVLLVNARGDLTPVRSAHGRTLIPVRGIIPIFNGSFDFVWEDGIVTAIITIGDTTLRFIDGSDIFYINGQPEPSMSAAPDIFEGSFYIPARYFSEALNMPITWEHTNGDSVVYINAK